METKYVAACIVTGLAVRHMNFTLRHFCDGSAAKSHASIGYVVQGESRLTTDDLSLSLQPGCCFYLPCGIRYRSNWTGTNEIEYYILHISTPFESDGEPYAASVLPSLSTPSTLAAIRRIEAGLAGNTEAQLRAMSEFYALYAEVIPLLSVNPKTKGNPILAAATGYIGEHFAEDFSVSDLASACSISESRLYHLFQEEMHISPIGYRNEIRINRAISLLHAGARQKEIAASTGFHSPAYFRDVFRAYTGLTPQEYRKVILEK